MERGKELEDDALGFVNIVTGMSFKKVGFLDSELGFGCSPDGLDKTCGLELKVPLAKTHVGYLREGVLPTKYFCQVQGSMLVTGFSHWYFCSYHPTIESPVLRIERDETYIKALELELLKCTYTIRTEVERLTK